MSFVKVTSVLVAAGGSLLQSIGAALAVKHACTPRDLYENHISELQQTLLKNDVFIPGVKNSDPADLARQATVTASSYDDAEARPDKIINGWARPLNGKGNMWISNAKEKLPQWIQLDFGRPVQCNTVHCTFDTNLDPRGGDSEALPKECVSNYQVECRVGGQWQTVARADNNYQRLCRHQFPTVMTEAIRLTVLATHGSPCARVFEIRAYQE